MVEPETKEYEKYPRSCCKKKQEFTPPRLICLGKELCHIPRGSKYFSYEDKYRYCLPCFRKFKGIVNVVADVSAPPIPIQKILFDVKKNDHIELEPLVSCTKCRRRYHKICVLHMDEIWPDGFICKKCLEAKNEVRQQNKFTAGRLATTRLGTHLERRVDTFMRRACPKAGKVHIRVLSSSEGRTEVKAGMKRKFSETGNYSYPYTSKAIFAFQEIDNTDVCFFGMYVQEYGSDCPLPNSRRVYVAYLDSVHFFQPKEHRTDVYHEILLGYLDYVKMLGFTFAHIWASPPSNGDDYIFYCHPPEQRIPDTKRLQLWYRDMLDKALAEGVIMDHKDILQQVKEDRVSSAAQLPYFDGDYWPDSLEAAIKTLDEEQAKELRAQNNPRLRGRRIAKRRITKKKNALETDDPLLARVSTSMESLKTTFFVIGLHSDKSAAGLPRIKDPDPISTCEMMDGRDGFLAMATSKHCEFSSLRRAKFSTMVMLYDLHTLQYIYTCDNCCKPMEGIRYYCPECEDNDSYDLCALCYQTTDHPHQMERVGRSASPAPVPVSERIPISVPAVSVPARTPVLVPVSVSERVPISVPAPVSARTPVSSVPVPVSAQTPVFSVPAPVLERKPISVPVSERVPISVSARTPVSSVPASVSGSAQVLIIPYRLLTSLLMMPGSRLRLPGPGIVVPPTTARAIRRRHQLLLRRRCELMMIGLTHASQCQVPCCELRACHAFKTVLSHVQCCSMRKTCIICKQVTLVCVNHANHCSNQNCRRPMCRIIKDKIQAWRRQHTVAMMRLMQLN